MERKVLLAVILTLVLSVLSLPASSQAIAESITLGAATSTAAGKAGSALGSALNRSTKQLAEHVQQQVSQPSQTSLPQSRREFPRTQSGSTIAHSAPKSSALTVSIQGAKPNCTNEQVSSQQGNTQTSTPSTSCISPNTSAKPDSQKYKSVVTVTFPN
jgi:hypothetical protein